MDEKKTTGILGSTLKQTFKQIKDSRIDAMLEDSELKYRRQIEDVCAKVRQCDRDLEDAILDIFKDMTNKGFFELVNKNTDTYIVTDAFAYIRDVVDMLTPKSDTYDETAQ